MGHILNRMGSQESAPQCTFEKSLEIQDWCRDQDIVDGNMKWNRYNHFSINYSMNWDECCQMLGDDCYSSASRKFEPNKVGMGCQTITQEPILNNLANSGGGGSVCDGPHIPNDFLGEQNQDVSFMNSHRLVEVLCGTLENGSECLVANGSQYKGTIQFGNSLPAIQCTSPTA